MKQKLINLSQRYMTTLRAHLQSGLPASLSSATRLGRQAVASGLETLELARMHEQALTALKLSKTGQGLIKRAEIFFIAANAQIIETHWAARQNKIYMSGLIATLGQRTKELAASNRQLRHGVAQRKHMEEDFAKRGRRHQKSLDESLDLQKRLRQLTHQVIAAQEDERKKISCELQDEIAQTLLGINVRLLSLKQDARRNIKGLKNQITSTQRLVVKSAQSVRLVGRKIGRL